MGSVNLAITINSPGGHRGICWSSEQSMISSSELLFPSELHSLVTLFGGMYKVFNGYLRCFPNFYHVIFPS